MTTGIVVGATGGIGGIVVIGSISASRALPRRAVYGASKAGIEHLARSLAAELGPAGFRVNIVAPGVVAGAPPYLTGARIVVDGGAEALG